VRRGACRTAVGDRAPFKSCAHWTHWHATTRRIILPGRDIKHLWAFNDEVVARDSPQPRTRGFAVATTDITIGFVAIAAPPLPWRGDRGRPRRRNARARALK
jgi:hypothetical protein